MKRLTVIMILGAFLIGGAIIHSCKKDEKQDVKTTTNLMLKAYDFDYPIIMGFGNNGDEQVQVGTANIVYDYANASICLYVDLDNLGDFYVEEAHYYMEPTEWDADGDIIPPPYPQSKWDGSWPDDGSTFGEWCETYAAEVTCGDCDPILLTQTCSYDFWWTFALHLQLGNDITGEEETAWMLCLNEDGSICGMNWWNGGGNHTKGWGQYIPVEFSDSWTEDCVPE